MIWMTLTTAYLAIATCLAFTQRRRWIKWQEREFPLLTRQGDYSAGLYIFTCAVWPVLWPVAFAHFHSPTSEGGATGFLLRGRQSNRHESTT